MCEYCNSTGIAQYWSRTTRPFTLMGCDICTDRWDFDELAGTREANGFPWNGSAFTCPMCGKDNATALYIEHYDDKIVGCDKCIDEEMVPFDDSVEFYPDVWRREDYLIDRRLDELKEEDAKR